MKTRISWDCLLAVQLVQLSSAADTRQSPSDLDTELMSAAKAASVDKVRTLLSQHASPNTLIDGKTAFLQADLKTRVDQELPRDRVAVLEAMIAAALTGVEHPPALKDIREGITQAMLDRHPMKFVASNLVQVYPDPAHGKAVRVRCDAIVYDNTAGYQMLAATAKGLAFEAPPKAMTWVAIAGTDNTDVRLTLDNRGRWKGEMVEGVGFARLQTLHSLSMSPDAYKADIGGGFPALYAAMIVGEDETACKIIDAATGQPPAAGLKFDPFVFAALSNCPKAMTRLLERGTKVDVTTAKDEATALCAAAQTCNTGIIRLLLEKGAAPNKTKKGGISALMMAAVVGDNESVEVLARRADVNAKSDKGWTALHFAASIGWLPVVYTLCDAKADVNAVTNDGETPLKLAEKGSYAEISAVLRKAGAGELAKESAKESAKEPAMKIAEEPAVKNTGVPKQASLSGVTEWKEHWGAPGKTDVTYHDAYRVTQTGEGKVKVEILNRNQRTFDERLEGRSLTFTQHTDTFVVKYSLALESDGQWLVGTARTPNEVVEVKWEKTK